MDSGPSGVDSVSTSDAQTRGTFLPASGVGADMPTPLTRFDADAAEVDPVLAAVINTLAALPPDKRDEVIGIITRRGGAPPSTRPSVSGDATASTASTSDGFVTAMSPERMVREATSPSPASPRGTPVPRVSFNYARDGAGDPASGAPTRRSRRSCRPSS